MLEPGARCRPWHEDGSGSCSWDSCSFGWFVGTSTQIYNLTAGHCGEVGDAAYVDISGKDSVYINEFVHSEFNNARLSTGSDYDLIEIESHYFDNDVTKPCVHMSDESVQIRGSADASWLEADEPYMCRLGFRTGLSCGPFPEITDQGDSGGVIWVFAPNDSSMQYIYAVAVNSYGSDYDATMTGRRLVKPVMTDFGFGNFN